MNANVSPHPETWEVRLRDEPGRVATTLARSAFAAWQACAAKLGNPAFAGVECRIVPLEEPPETKPIVATIVAALDTPANLNSLRSRLARAGRAHLSTAEVLAAVTAGAIEFDHLTQKYRRAP